MGQYVIIRCMRINADFTRIIKKIHEEKWVALSEDHSQVVDFDKNFLALTKRMDKKGDRCVYMKVLRSDIEYSFAPFAWCIEFA
jgi:hypothetical protein